MTNTESFALIAKAISNTEAALAHYDSLSERAARTQDTVTALEAEIAAIHRNDAGLDSKARISRLTNSTSALALAQSDLVKAQDALAAQEAVTLKDGKATAEMLLEVRDVFRTQRLETAETWLTATFDWGQIPVIRPRDLAAAHESVTAIGKLSVTNLPDELSHDDNFTIGTLRRLGEYFTELRPLIEAEPNLFAVTDEPAEAEGFTEPVKTMAV